MQAPPIPEDEARRLTALRCLRILDTASDERFERVTRLTCRLLGVPIALVSLVDDDRQWFKSRQGLETHQTPREISFCGHAILHEELLLVPDALQDPRFCDNPLVAGEPQIRFYAGQPLHAPDGSRVGTLCAIDRQPREIPIGDLACLADLAGIVDSELLALSLAARDPLTGLANRSSLESVARRQLEKLATSRFERSLSLLVFDLNGFKSTNDELGHAAGDVALRQFGSALRSAFRECDLVSRIGGDEFAVLLEGEPELAEPPLRRLERLVAVLNEARHRDLPIRYSVGLACFDPARHRDLLELFVEADRRMYAAKRAGRTRRALA